MAENGMAVAFQRVAWPGPLAAFAQAGAAIDGGAAVVAFGGLVAEREGDVEAATADVWIDGVVADGIDGMPPAARYAHTATALWDPYRRCEALLVVGGRSRAEVFDDAHLLVLDEQGGLSWHRLALRGDVLPPRAHHSATLVGVDRVLLFGGHDGAALSALVVAIDIDFATLEATVTCIPPAAAGYQGPSARAGHSACLLAGRVVVFGGWTGDKRAPPNGQVFVLAPEAMRWSAPQCEHADSIPQLARHSCAKIGAHRMLVFGGQTGDGDLQSRLFVFDLEQLAWRHGVRDGSISDEWPSPRHSHLCLANPQTRSLLLLGGFGADDVVCDAWVVHLDRRRALRMSIAALERENAALAALAASQR